MGHCEAGGGFGAARDIQRSWERAVHDPLTALHVLLEHWPSPE
jgi:hypothetical protein